MGGGVDLTGVVLLAELLEAEHLREAAHERAIRPSFTSISNGSRYGSRSTCSSISTEARNRSVSWSLTAKCLPMAMTS